MCEQTAIITGVSRGLGHALAHQLIAAGTVVVGLSRSETTFAASPSVVVQGDVTSGDAIERVREALGDRPLDLLVNNAAVGGRARELSDGAIAEMRRAFDVNVLGAAQLVAAVRPALARAPQPLIVNVGSRMGRVDFNRSLAPDAPPASYAYRVSKAALEMLTVAMARELDGVATVLCLDPGPMRTAMGRPEADRDAEDVAAEIVRRLDAFRQEPSGSMVTLD